MCAARRWDHAPLAGEHRSQERLKRGLPSSHAWDAVHDELGDSLGSPAKQAQRVEQLRRELALLRLVEPRKRSGLRQADVAERMGVSKARVSHLEHGAVATIDLLARYPEAIGAPQSLLPDGSQR